LLGWVRLRLVVPTEVRRETVEDRLARGYADAAAIERAIAELPVTEDLITGTVDAAVLEAGRAQGVLVTNDALGRRAANLGIRWLRTADLIVLCVHTGSIGPQRGVRAAAPGGCLRGAALRGPLDRAAPACRLRVAGAAEAGALDAYRSGRGALRDFGRALGLTTWQAHDLLRAEGVAVAPVAIGPRAGTPSRRSAGSAAGLTYGIIRGALFRGCRRERSVRSPADVARFCQRGTFPEEILPSRSPLSSPVAWSSAYSVPPGRCPRPRRSPPWPRPRLRCPAAWRAGVVPRRGDEVRRVGGKLVRRSRGEAPQRGIFQGGVAGWVGVIRQVRPAHGVGFLDRQPDRAIGVGWAAGLCRTTSSKNQDEVTRASTPGDPARADLSGPVSSSRNVRLIDVPATP